MKSETIEQKIIELVKEQVYPAQLRDRVALKADLVNDLLLDSMDLVELSSSIEEELGVEIPYSVADKWDMVEDIVEYVSIKLRFKSET